MPPTTPPTRLRLTLAGALLPAAAAAVALGGCDRQRPAPAGTPAALTVDAFCAGCHKLPPPSSLPRGIWPAAIESMYGLAGHSPEAPIPSLPPMEEAVRKYVAASPPSLASSPSTAGAGKGPAEFTVVPLAIDGLEKMPAAANVRFVSLGDPPALDLVISDMRAGMVLAMQPSRRQGTIRLLGRVPHPCHVEAADIDQDGARDLLVANLGTMTPSDATDGSIVWLRRSGQDYHAVTIAANLGRVAEAQAADFDLDGDVDVVAAVFGWRSVGELLLLEQRPGKRAKELVSYMVDPRSGAIHVPIADLNGDGLPDFVALISQQHEAVVAFINRGKLRFDARTLFEAPHPGWGYAGMELVDLDGDGDLDVLLANGDTLDNMVLKPYHGIAWLENLGDLRFAHHALTALHGAYSARAADVDGDGDLDVLASVFLPWIPPTDPELKLADSLIWLERQGGRFARHSLEAANCRHPSLDAADFDADGDVDFAAGNMTLARPQDAPLEDWALLFRNERSKAK